MSAASSPAKSNAAPAAAPAAAAEAAAPMTVTGAGAAVAVVNEQTLLGLWSRTNEQLDSMWSQMGLSGDERRAAVMAVGDKLAAVAAACVQAAQGDKAALQAAIHALRAEIVDTCSRLGRIYWSDEYTRLDAAAPLRAQQQQLEAKRAQLNAIRDEHEAKLKAALSDLHAVWTRLGVAIAEQTGFEGVGHDLSEAKVAAVCARFTEAQADVLKRVAAITAAMKTAAELIRELSLSPADLTGALDAKIVAADIAGLGVHISALTEVEARVNAFKALKAARQQRIQALAVDIQALWNRLKIKDSERNAFFAKHTSLNASTITACENELDRCRQLKRLGLRDFCLEAKQKLQALWDDTLVHPSERAKCRPMQALLSAGAGGAGAVQLPGAELYTDECLEAVESEIARCEARAARMQPLLAVVRERAEILEEKAAFDALCAAEPDPAKRFRIPKFTLREENVRKLMATKLPKLNAALRAQIPAWEQVNGPLVLPNGVGLLALIAAEEGDAAAAAAAAQAKADTKKSARAKGENVAPTAAATAAGSKTPSKGAAKAAGKGVAAAAAASGKRPSTAAKPAAAAAAAAASGKKGKASGADSARGSVSRPVLGALNFNDS